MEKEQFDNDDVFKNIIRKGGLEQPSFDFTQNIMSKIQSSNYSSVYAYQPVISKKVWMFVSAVVAFLLIFILLLPATENVSNLSKYINPVQNIVSSATAGFIRKLSVLNSLSWILAVLAACWLLFATDNWLMKKVIAK